MAFRLGNVEGRAVLVDDQDDWYDLGTLAADDRLADPMVALAHLDAVHAAGERVAEATPDGIVHEHSLGPPVPEPRQVFAVGLNYRSHAEESGLEVPPAPLVFTKFPACLVGPDATVDLRSTTVDWEVEAVVVIGRGGRDIPAAEAWHHVAGVTVGQDLSDRVLQFASSPPHFDLGKSHDGYGPIGPVVVSTDLLTTPDDLALRCSVNGEVRQDDRTSGLIFGVPALVEYLSGILTLAPGDLVFTGTPAGVGVSTGTFLAPGDVIESTIDGIGTLRTTCG